MPCSKNTTRPLLSAYCVNVVGLNSPPTHHGERTRRQEQHGISHTRTNQRMTSTRTTAKCVVDMPSIGLLVSSVAWAICSVVEMSAPTSRHRIWFMNTWHMLCKKTRHTLILYQRGTNVQYTDMKADGEFLYVWRFAWAWSKESDAPTDKSDQPITSKLASRKHSSNNFAAILNVI